MNGYIINFYRYATYPSSHAAEFRKILTSIPESSPQPKSKSMLAYGEFDRVNIEKINDFSRYRDIGNHTKTWHGARQSALLYQIEDNPNDLLSKIIENNQQNHADDQSANNHLLVFTMVTLDPKCRQSSNFGGILKNCREIINCAVNKIKHSLNHTEFLYDSEHIDFEVYGTFSSSELAIVWQVSQYADAFYLADYLRTVLFSYHESKEKDENAGQSEPKYIHPFISFYSLVAHASATPNTTSEAGYFQSEYVIQGSAEICFQHKSLTSENSDPNTFLTKNFHLYFDELKTELERYIRERQTNSHKAATLLPHVEIEEKSTAGEFDFSLIVPADLVCHPQSPLFHSNGELHWKNERFSKFVMKTQTRLCYEKKGFPDPVEIPVELEEHTEFPYKITEDIKNKIYGNKERSRDDNTLYTTNLNDDNFMTMYRTFGLRKIIRKQIPETVGLCDTLDLLYLDYVNNCTNLISDSWAHDLSDQFSGVLDYIAHLIRQSLDCNKGNPSHMFLQISQIANEFKQIIYHIAQSRRTFFVVPSCHLRYLGHYDMILHAYYGLQKYLLNLSWRLDSTDYQPKLIPLYTLDVVPELHTKLYMMEAPEITHTPSDEQTKSKPQGLFSINLPLTAIVDFLRYSMMITHETFHLIPPRDRNRRNQIMGMLFFSEFCARITLRALLELYDSHCQETPASNIKVFLSEHFDTIVLHLIPFYFQHGRSYYLELIHNEIIRPYVQRDTGYLRYPIWKDYLSRLICTLRDILESPDSNANLYEMIQEINSIHAANMKNTIRTLFEKIETDYRNSARTFITAEEKDELLHYAFIHITPLHREKTPSPLGFNIWIPDFISISQELSEAFREASQDLPMIRLFNLSIVDYLVFRDRHKNDLLDLNQQNKYSDQLRIALLCDYLLSQVQENQFDELLPVTEVYRKLEGYRTEYISLFKNVPEMRKNDKSVAEQCLDSISRAFDLNMKSFQVYAEKFTSIRFLLINQLREADILYHQENVREDLSSGFLSAAYSSWKAAIQIEDSAHRESSIFKNNLKMIHHFQKQTDYLDPDLFNRRNTQNGG